MHNEALTGLGITIALAAVLMIAAVALALLHGGAPHPPRGIIPGAVDEATGTLVVSGPVMGFAATSRDILDTRVSWSPEQPGAMGAVMVTVGLVAGKEPVSRKAMTVAIGRQGRAPELLIWADGSLHEGTWTIAGKRHRTPSEEADDDDLLEGGELFDLVLVPAAAFFPGDMLSVSVDVSGRNALSCSRTVPAGITPVMNLG